MQGTESMSLQRNPPVDPPPAQALGQQLVLANSLKWLAPEVDASLARARALIDQHQEDEGSEFNADPVLAELRLVLGALRMAGCHGGALLVEEICSAIDAVAGGQLAQPGAALAAVSGATLQLSDYLDALRHGAPDRAAVLQPTVSEMRLACGRVAITEADLFVRQMLLINPPLRLPETGSEPLLSASIVAGKLLPAFQVLLLQWLKGVDVPNTLLKLRKVGDHISSHALRRETALLWSAFAAAIDSLVAVPGADSLELKRWVGRLGQQIKLLAEQGEAACAAQSPELAWRLLACAGPIHHGGSRWLMLRHYLPLDSTLAIEPALSAARQQLRGPNTRLLEKVAEEVRVDLALVKDGLDLALRAGGLASDVQATLADRLSRIANTLVLLGLPQLEQVLRSQTGELATLGSGQADGEGRWMRIATALLRVEHSLETALYRPLRQMRSEPQRELPSELNESIPHAQDLRESVAALLREMLVDLAKLKARLDAYLKGAELRDESEPRQLLTEVASGLVMLNLLPAAQLCGELRDWLASAGAQGLRSDPATATRFAESVAALELYLEALRDALPQPERMLETLSVALAALAPGVPAAAQSPADDSAAALLQDASEAALLSTDLPAEPLWLEAPVGAVGNELPAAEAIDQSTDGLIAEPPPLDFPDPLPEVVEDSKATPVAVPVALAPPLRAPPAAGPAAGDDDPEIRAIFIEEAQEVLDGLRRQLPAFRRDAEEPALLGEIRRAFHTLKGSGRMVGATRIGELGWAIEHLLNRCIEGALPVNESVVTMVSSAIEQLPQLLVEFSEGQPPDPLLEGDDAAQALMARAHFLASGRAPEMVEAEVLAVFRTDAQDRLSDVERWLAMADEGFIDADTVRALHTLKGSAAVVNAERLSQLSGALESVLKQFIAADLPVSSEVRAVLAEVLPVLRAWTAEAGSASTPQGAAEWLARVEALKAFLPPPGDARSAAQRESLVNVAFGRLQEVEQQLMAWTVAPAEHSLCLLMADAAAVLATVARECLPLSRGAEAMAQRLREPDLQQQAPEPGFFIALTNALEHFYQFLDAYREGGIRDSGRELAELLLRLPLHSAAATPAVESAAATAEPVLPEALAVGQGESSAEPALEAEPTLQSEPESAPDLALQLHVISHAVPVPPDDIDAELGELFHEEARELLAVLQQQTPAWQPPAPASPEILHALHTLTGSSRMVGYTALGDLAHRFERRLTGLDFNSAAASLLQAELLDTVPVFEQAIDAFEIMLPQAAERIAARAASIDSEAPQPVSTEPERDPEPEFAAQLPQAEFVPAAEVPPPSSVAAGLPSFDAYLMDDSGAAGAADGSGWLLDDGVSDDLAQETAAPLPEFPEPTEASLLHPLPSLLDRMEEFQHDSTGRNLGAPVERQHHYAAAETAEGAAAETALDPDLANIFIAEAEENLETIESSLSAWQQDRFNASAVGDLLRALHTLKGGARMTGFLSMGDVTHAMESRLSEILSRGNEASDSEHAALKAELNTLENMHDALARGQYAAALQRMAPVEPEAVEEPMPRAKPAPVAPAVLAPAEGWEPLLFWQPAQDETSAARRELARVPVENLDAMLNEAGEISIYRSRLEQQNAVLVAQLTEMRQTIMRLREQLRLMDAETDAQIAARGLNTGGAGDAPDRYEQDFDPLEMDRYSRMQELSRALAEAVGDLGSLHLTMDQGVNEAQALLLQQGRINTTVQQGLMSTLMVPFSRQVARLQRVVRQTAQEEAKYADVLFEGVESELDRNVLERMTAPLEHLLRNAVVHGLETPDGRAAAGKPAVGTVSVNLKREGTQLVMEVADDGAGLNYSAIRTKAIERGLLPIGAELADEEIARFIFEAGFSTAETLTQTAGRGVGMDVVASEVKQLGGSLELRSETGRGTRFIIRLPLSLALSQALMVKVGEETYALPLVAIEGIGRVPRAEAITAAGGGEATLSYGGHDYRVRSLAELIDLTHTVPEDSRTVPAVLVRLGEGLAGGERRAALIVDQLLGNREVVSKAVGPQLSSISGVSGATILPSGEVVLILDPAALVIDRARRRLLAEAAANRASLERQATQQGRLIMVVDDSVTMRRVAERLLQRSGYRVITAKDGLDAIAQLQNEFPSAILLDIEMPRADGFEVAGFVRNNERLAETPIIMITSRSGDKHRTRAASLGVNRYLIKPYQEEQLLHELRTLLQAKEAEAA